MMVTNWG